MSNVEQLEFDYVYEPFINDELEESIPPPVSVLLYDRAQNLLECFDYILESHKDTGRARNAEGPKQGTKLMERKNLDEGALNSFIQALTGKSGSLNYQARRIFAEAIGHNLVGEAGFLPSEELEAMANYDFDDIEKKYFNIPNKHKIVDAEDERLTDGERKAKRKLRTQKKLEVTTAREEFVLRLKKYLGCEACSSVNSDTIE